MPLVTSGVEKGNLRELALARMDDLGLKCRDVRTREAGIQVSNIDYLQIYVIEHCYFLYSSSNMFPILHYIYRIYTTKLGQMRFSLFGEIILPMRDGKLFFHMKTHAR